MRKRLLLPVLCIVMACGKPPAPGAPTEALSTVTPTAPATPSSAASTGTIPAKPVSHTALERLEASQWILSLEDSPALAAKLRSACGSDSDAQDCFARLRAQSAREGLRVERRPGEPSLELIRFDGDTDLFRRPYSIALDDAAHVVLEATGRGASERVSFVVTEKGDLHLEDPRHGLMVYKATPLRAKAPPAEATPPAAGPSSTWTALETRPADASGWAPYAHANAYDATNVAGVFPGGASPEAAVTHYLASRVRGDTRYREVLSAQCDDRCQRKRAKHDRWTFLSFQLISRTDAPNGGVSLKVQFRIRTDKQTDQGIDEFLVLREGGSWRIVELPT